MRLLALALAMGALIEQPLDRRAIDEALLIANSSSETAHLRFHADYRVPVGTAPVDFVSIVSPFRRLVLGAESENRLGRGLFGQREALALLAKYPEGLEVYAELTFHPLNTFVYVPEHTVVLEPVSFRGPVVEARGTDRLPRFGPRVDDRWYPFPYPFPTNQRVPTASEPLLGATLIARFATEDVDPRAIYSVVVKDGPKELGRARVDFARLR